MSITSQSLWWEPDTLVRQYAPALILIWSLVFSGDQDWPLGIVIACVHVCVSVCAHHPFKLGSRNFDQRCERPWLR